MTAYSTITLSVVFSFRNEEQNIPQLLARVRTACKPLGLKELELVFVNDCSTDSSLDLLMADQEQEGDIVVVNTSRRFGVAEGVMCGMKESKGDYVVYMDSDLQDPPELIPELLNTLIAQKAEVVFTTRRSRRGETWFKLGITKFGYWILNKLSSIEVHPNSGDFKLLSRKVVDHVVKMKEQKPFMRGLVTWVGFKQVQVLYDRDPRAGGKSNFSVISKHVLYHFLDTALISFSDAPLKLALFMGTLVTAGSFLLFVWILVQKALGWALPGWTAVMATLLVLGGIQLFMMGILGLYIHTIYLEVKGRPLYIVDRVLRPGKKNSLATGTGDNI